jgi:hypothetical protein
VFSERVSLAVSQMMRDAGKSLVPLAESIEWWTIQIGMDSTNFEHMSKRVEELKKKAAASTPPANGSA